MSNLILTAYTRGSQAHQDGRNFVLAELYGGGGLNQHLALEAAAAEKILSAEGEASLIDLSVDGGAVVSVIIKEVQREPLKQRLLHLDFMRVEAAHQIIVEVALHPVGHSNAVSILGGTLIKNLDKLKVECLPDKLVSHLDIDVTPLVELHDVIRVSDLSLPEGLKTKVDPQQVIFSVAAARKAVVETPAATEEVKVETSAAPIEGEAPAKKQ